MKSENKTKRRLKIASIKTQQGRKEKCMLLEIGLITMMSLDKPDLLWVRESSKVVPFASLQVENVVARYETEVSEYNKTEKYSLQVGYKPKNWLEIGGEMRKEGDFIYLKVSHSFGK